MDVQGQEPKRCTNATPIALPPAMVRPGIERQAKYVDIAQRRLDGTREHVRQPRRLVRTGVSDPRASMKIGLIRVSHKCGEKLRIHLVSGLLGSHAQCMIRSRSGAGPNRRNVTPRPDGRWNVRRPGGQRASVVTDTQKQAIDRGRDLLRRAGGGELTIHNRQGKFRDSDTVAAGRDPNPPKDTK